MITTDWYYSDRGTHKPTPVRAAYLGGDDDDDGAADLRKSVGIRMEEKTWSSREEDEVGEVGDAVAEEDDDDDGPVEPPDILFQRGSGGRG